MMSSPQATQTLMCSARSPSGGGTSAPPPPRPRLEQRWAVGTRHGPYTVLSKLGEGALKRAASASAWRMSACVRKVFPSILDQLARYICATSRRSCTMLRWLEPPFSSLSRELIKPPSMAARR
jgi:hypothetical protein